MELPAIDFYGFVGIVIPGTMLLVGVNYLFQLGELNSFLVPNNFGSLGVHLLVAYLIGHLLQGIGNVIESIYWKLWKGMPTDWPISRPAANIFPRAVSLVCKFTEREEPKGKLNEKIKEWRHLVAQARSTVYSSGRASRLQVFNGNYGMFRGVLASVLIISILAFRSSVTDKNTLYAILLVTAVLTIYRMHRFAVNYAKELFANVAELTRIKD